MKQSWFIFGAWQVELALAQKLLLSPEELPHSPHLCQNPRSHVSYFVCHFYYFLSSLPEPKIKLPFQKPASYFVGNSLIQVSYYIYLFLRYVANVYVADALHMSQNIFYFFSRGCCLMMTNANCHADVSSGRPGWCFLSQNLPNLARESPSVSSQPDKKFFLGINVVATLIVIIIYHHGDRNKNLM